MAEAVGVAAAIIQFLEVLKAAYRGVTYGSRVTRKLDRVLQRVEPCRVALEDDDRTRSSFQREALAHHLSPTLNDIKSILDSIPHPPTPSPHPAGAASTNASKFRFKLSVAWYGVKHGHFVNTVLDIVLSKLSTLQDLATLHTAVNEMERLPISSGLPEESHVSIGLDRAHHEVLEFIMNPSASQSLSSQPTATSASTTNTSVLQCNMTPSARSQSSSSSSLSLVQPSSSVQPSTSASTSTQLRIVGIVGQGGLGKCTLLAHILNQVKHCFRVMAYVKIEGQGFTSKACRDAQSCLVRGLDGPFMRFLNENQGRAELLERLERLQKLESRVCIAIENVWRAEDIKALFPQGIANRLPDLNMCIIITTRLKSNVDKLTCHCGGNPRVLSFEPQLLQELPAEQLLLAHANMQMLNPVTSNEKQLVERIFPFCGGLPLALRLVGEKFRQERDVQTWEDWIRDMAPEIARVPIADIDHILELSYNHLQSSDSREALVDIGAFFSDQPWDTVKSIFGSMPMIDLEDLSLIFPVTQDSASSVSERVVRMHSLIRKLAAEKQASAKNTVKIWDPERWSPSLLSNDQRIYGDIKYLRLDMEKAHQEAQKLDGKECLVVNGSCFQHMKKLKVLEISGSFSTCTQLLLPISLRSMKLECNMHFTINVNFPSHLQRLELRRCVNLTELPASIYSCTCLTYLCIIGCPSLRGFQHLSNWTNLSRLRLEECKNITNLPEDLGKLERLTLVECPVLQDNVPKLYIDKLDPQPVHIRGSHPASSSSSNTLPPRPPLNQSNVSRASLVPKKKARLKGSRNDSFGGELEELRALSDDRLKTLVKVTITYCRDRQDAAALGLILVKMVSLEELRLINWDWLELGGFPVEMPKLTKLRVEFNQLLQVLRPESLCNVTSLVVLSFENCTQLQMLPEEVGRLTLLETLNLQGCESLVHLPGSMCALSSLKKLDLTRCTSLKELPHKMHLMTGLRRLLLESCTSLKTLPSAICRLENLEELNMAMCFELEELPEPMGSLTSLRKVSLKDCFRLRRLPVGLSNLGNYAGTELVLEGCFGLDKS